MDTHSFYSISTVMYSVSRLMCLLTFSLMLILLLGYTPRLRLFGYWLCSSRPLMTVADYYDGKISVDSLVSQLKSKTQIYLEE